MVQAQLGQFFKDNGITPKEIAQKTGFSIRYIYNLLNGSDRLSNSARFKFLQAFPQTAIFLLPESTEITVEEKDGKLDFSLTTPKGTSDASTPTIQPSSRPSYLPTKESQ